MFISELEKGKKLAQFMMAKLPHILPFSEVGFSSSINMINYLLQSVQISTQAPGIWTHFFQRSLNGLVVKLLAL